MGFWWFMFVCNLLIPVVMLVGGRIMWKKCPKQINGLVGYRTSRSMKNMDTWRFAHDCVGRLWWKIGFIMLVLSALVQIPFLHSGEEVVGTVSLVLCTVQLVVLIASVIPVEAALKRTFHEDGTRK